MQVAKISCKVRERLGTPDPQPQSLHCYPPPRLPHTPCCCCLIDSHPANTQLPSPHPPTTLPTHRRHSMLPSARLRDDALLGHALAQQRLPECIVDLVRAGVVKVLAFQIDEGHAAVSPEWWGEKTGEGAR